MTRLNTLFKRYSDLIPTKHRALLLRCHKVFHIVECLATGLPRTLDRANTSLLVILSENNTFDNYWFTDIPPRRTLSLETTLRDYSCHECTPSDPCIVLVSQPRETSNCIVNFRRDNFRRSHPFSKRSRAAFLFRSVRYYFESGSPHLKQRDKSSRLSIIKFTHNLIRRPPAFLTSECQANNHCHPVEVFSQDVTWM